MASNLFYRNIRAKDLLEFFLVSAVTSLLLLRGFLAVSGYPQVGGGNLHIAHMLWGGLLMLAAIVMLLSFLGARVQRLAAIVGGAGFGIFIDELGKFITKDNNYFFRPTIGIIYALFISLYLLFNFLGREGRLSAREYELNALDQLTETVLEDLDPLEKARIKRLLKRADQRSPVTQALQRLVTELPTVPLRSPLFSKLLKANDRWYKRFWARRRSRQLVAAIFIAEAALYLLGIVATVYSSLHSFTDVFSLGSSYGHKLVAGQLLSSLLAAGLVVAGALQLQASRLKAFELWRRATLINLFLTEFFIFSRLQLRAIPSFVANLLLLLLLRFLLHHERRASTSP